MNNQRSSHETHHNVVIVGGGLVGASLALALRGLDCSIAMVEAVSPGRQVTSDYDARSLVLSEGSRRILASLGLWSSLAPATMPIQQIHVSDKGHFGVTRFNAEDEGAIGLGHVIEVPQLTTVLQQHVKQHPTLTHRCPARVMDVTRTDNGYQLAVEQDERQSTITCDLLVVADGANSGLRKQLNIATRRHDYQQSAVVANVSLSRSHHQVAYERFTKTGPIALLPLTQNRCGMVWTAPPQQAEQLCALSASDFLQALQQCFGYRLGRFTQVGQRSVYPLKLVVAEEQVRPGVVLLGNSAHSLHPLAAQGFNLSLRDVSVLADVLSQAMVERQSIGSLAVLERYVEQRQTEQQQIIRLTDGLARLFVKPQAPVIWGRNLGLVSLDLLPPAKHLFAKYTMGLAGRLSRLARGLSLQGAS